MLVEMTRSPSNAMPAAKLHLHPCNPWRTISELSWCYSSWCSAKHLSPRIVFRVQGTYIRLLKRGASRNALLDLALNGWRGNTLPNRFKAAQFTRLQWSYLKQCKTWYKFRKRLLESAIGASHSRHRQLCLIDRCTSLPRMCGEGVRFSQLFLLLGWSRCSALLPSKRKTFIYLAWKNSIAGTTGPLMLFAIYHPSVPPAAQPLVHRGKVMTRPAGSKRSLQFNPGGHSA